MLNLFLPTCTIHRDDALQTACVEEVYLLLEKEGEGAREKSQQAK